MKEIKEYNYRKFESKYFKDLVIIIKKAFDKSMHIDFLKKKYNSRHLGIDYISTIAFDGDHPIGFYGAIPQLFKNGNESVLIAHACDSYTVPGYQKKGVHYNLARLSYSLMKSQNIKMVYAYHSKNTYYSTKKLDWKEYISLKRFHIPTGIPPISKGIRKLGLNHFYQKVVTAKLTKYFSAPFENPFAKEQKSYQIYTKAFYQYKDGISKHYTINIEDCSFYFKVDAILLMGHIDFPDAAALKRGLIALKKICQSLGISEILLQVDTTSRLYEALCTLDYAPFPSWLIGYLPFDASFDISKYGFNYSELDTF